MVKKDERVDRYIEGAATFAKPILKHVRRLVHKACPAATETMKWGFPHFMYHGILCSIASFKEHCAFTFWKGSLLNDPENMLEKRRGSGMGHLGKINNIKQLPSEETIIAFIKEAMQLNKDDVKLPRASKGARSNIIEVPTDLAEALLGNHKAQKTFEAFSNTNKRDYIEWLQEAKTEATRKKRLATTLTWLEEGKVRNWKYIKC